MSRAVTTSSDRVCIVLHRAKVNAGDFLIRERALRLLASHRPDLAVTLGEAWRPLRDQFDAATLASARAIVIAGGPGYQRNMVPGVYPLAPLAELRSPVVLMALGSFSYREAPAASVFKPRSAEFLRWVAGNGGRLGARDELSARLVKGLGVPVTMTGDPAWYDSDWLSRDDYGMADDRVAFTPPADPLFHAQGMKLLRALTARFGPDRMLVVFHRGSQPAFADACAKAGIRTHDITDGAEGFRIFDEVGLHVGYRVHAHLYCLSHATPSYLVAEDTRGIGVHVTLGPLGVDGRETTRGLLAAWRRRPRLAKRTGAVRRLAAAPPWLGGMPDVSGPVLSKVEAGLASGFEGHRTAKARIRATYPTMVELLQAIP